jgi:methionyl-tRNA synthetase
MTDQRPSGGPPDLKTVFSRISRPARAVVTAGMPYANGPLHLGHLAGAHVPADIHARFMGMLIGRDNVLFVCGTDDHGSTSEVSAIKAGVPVQEFIGGIREKQKASLSRYGISLNVYSGTSTKENFPRHSEYCQNFLKTLHQNQMLYKKTSEQWFDTKLALFLPDRYVTGTCPRCANPKAYSDECDACGASYNPSELLNPVSALSDETPVLKETTHWWLDMWKVSDELKTWIESKQKTWLKSVFQEVSGTIAPSISFSNQCEETFKGLKDHLPKHKSRYAPGKQIVAQFDNLTDLASARTLLQENGVETSLVDGWAHRSITRDVKWGIPIPPGVDAELEGKTLYVWPESLIAPISFTRAALAQKGQDEASWSEYWTNPDARVYQFIGQDNVYFYVLMQGAMWLGTQADPHRLPIDGELQLTDVFSRFHLHVDGEKMSKSKGNFYSADQLVDEMGFDPDQVRHFLALLSLTEKSSNFDFETFKERNRFLAGPLNAAFEKPIAAAQSKFNGVIPEGELIGKTEKETQKILMLYLRSMERADYSQLLFMIENYARIINGLFSQYKPHDDRHDEKQRKDALYSCFFILKNVMIMLYPFVPTTMDRLRRALNLPESVFSIDELLVPIAANHQLGEQQSFFPSVEQNDSAPS